MAEPKQKIAILLPNLGGGGAERVALASAKDLSERGHKVDFVLVQARGELLPLVPNGVRVVDLEAPRMLAALPALIRYLRAEAPYALHAHMWPLTIIAIMAHKLAKSDARLVVTDHTTLSRQLPNGFRRLLLKWTTRTFYPLADARSIVSNVAADDLARLSGMPRNEIAVIHNPVSPPADFATSKKVEASWGGPGPRLISVGNLHAVKNHALLLDAFSRLERKNARLLVLGEGPLRGQLEQQARQLGIADRVALPGFAIDPWPYLASADLFVLSSDYEGFPMALAEAMHAGLKIVSTDCASGPAEMLDGGHYGRLVRCGDAEALAEAIGAALDEPADPSRIQRRAAEIAGQAMTNRYRELVLG